MPGNHAEAAGLLEASRANGRLKFLVMLSRVQHGHSVGGRPPESGCRCVGGLRGLERLVGEVVTLGCAAELG